MLFSVCLVAETIVSFAPFQLDAIARKAPEVLGHCVPAFSGAWWTACRQHIHLSVSTGCLTCVGLAVHQTNQEFLDSPGPAAERASAQLIREQKWIQVSNADGFIDNCGNCEVDPALVAVCTALLRASIVGFSSVACFPLGAVSFCLMCCGNSNPSGSTPPQLVNPRLLLVLGTRHTARLVAARHSGVSKWLLPHKQHSRMAQYDSTPTTEACAAPWRLGSGLVCMLTCTQTRTQTRTQMRLCHTAAAPGDFGRSLGALRRP